MGSNMKNVLLALDNVSNVRRTGKGNTARAGTLLPSCVSVDMRTPTHVATDIRIQNKYLDELNRDQASSS